MALTWLLSCGHGSAPLRPTAVDARAYHYTDNSGLVVGTYGASVAQALPGRLTVEAQALADRVVVDSRRVLDPGRESLGKVTADAVTSASSTVAMGRVAREWRYEGTAALTHDTQIRGRPVRVGALGRLSTEPDYDSVSGAVRAGVELADRNTAIDLSLGFGRDEVKPVAAPAEMEALWPARHRRLTGTLALTQIVSRAAVVTAGVGATFQRGRLSSPYRNAIVNTTFYPEVLPDARERYTGFVGLSWNLDGRTALHLRQGGYLDSWQVRAIVPEVTLARELEPGVLVAGRYRLYRQTAASFYRPRYDDRAPILAGDQRLGAIQDHHVGFDLRWSLPAAPGRGLLVLAGYDLSLLDYRSIDTRIVAHVFGLGLESVF